MNLSDLRKFGVLAAIRRELRPHFVTQTVHPLSRLHVMTVVAAEQQTLNYYMNHGPDFKALERRLFQGDVTSARLLLRRWGPRLRRLGRGD